MSGGCDSCGGTGYVSSTRMVEVDDPGKAGAKLWVPHAYAARCVCMPKAPVDEPQARRKSRGRATWQEGGE